MKSLSAFALTALALLSSSFAQTHPAAEARRFTRGNATDPLIQSVVIPADQQRGIELIPTGNNAALYPNVPAAQLPWFCRIQRQQRFHIVSVAEGSFPAYAASENPIVAFGESGGGTPLYSNRDYRFGAFAGLRDYTNSQNPFRGIFRIRAYLASALASRQTNVAPADETTFELPWPGDANWNQFLLDGARKVVDFHGLKTTIQIVGGAVSHGDPEQWKTWDDPFVITHRASATDYYFVVEYQGYTVDFGFVDPIVSTVATGQPSPGFSPLYALDFTGQTPWRSTFVHAPQFTGEAVPSWYYGKSLEELQGAWSFSPHTPAAALQNRKGTAYLDYSAELRAHPLLDEFVTSMGSDPIALANYVFNEIELTDPVSYNENGGFDEASINCGGLNRGALATFLEGQGNPWEQCSLLVYLLRKANVAAVYCEPEKDKLGMLDTQLSHLLRMQIRGAQTPDGSTPMPTIVPTNYPWVAAWIESESRWVHLFPWIKDTEVIEGGNLYDQFPAGTKTGSAWVQKYVQGDPYDPTTSPSGIVPEQVAAYQESGGVVSIEAEGYHEHVPRASIRWEPLDADTPSGYSGASWMRAMPNSGTNITTNVTTTASRLDYKVNFQSGTSSYAYIRGYADTTNDNTVHVGLDGTLVGTVTAGSTGAWVWAGPVTLNHTAGLHTVNLWMAKDGFRVDKIVLTTTIGTPSGTGPAVSKQPPVEANVPSNLFPLYARRNLGANTSFDDLGMRFRDRRYYRTTWDDFPKPFSLYTGSHQTFEKLADRANTFDTVRVQLWSDRNGDGVYNGSSVDAAYLDTGEWLSTDLHNRRLYTACRKTAANTHLLRLYLAPYRSTASGTGTFTTADKVQEQLLTATLVSSDDNLQFEITHRRQKKVSKFGIVSVDVVNGGSGYTSAPSVTIAAPPAGTGHRTATATAQVTSGKVTSITITDPGFGYATAPTVTFTGGGGSGAQGRANLEDYVARWTHPLGINVNQITTQKPSIRKGELAAICLNFGRVSESMLRAHAEDFWSFERSLQATPSLKDDVSFQEKMQSTSAYLMGLSYYNRVGRWKETDERLHKTRVFTMYAAGLSKLAPYRDPALAFTSPTFGLPNSGDIIPRQATVDMFFLNAAYASNASVHPDSGLPFDASTKDFWHLLIAEISAQEHAIINDYYKESAAISTIRLLHRARTLPAGILRLTKANFAGFGSTNYTFGSTTKTLSAWDPSMWASITAAFNGLGGDYAEVFITPGPVASASAAYTGMGAMVFANDEYSALISGNMGLSNGGAGSLFSAPYYSAPSLPSITLTSTSNNYSISLTPPISVSNPIVAPASSSLWNIGTTASNLSIGSYIASTPLVTSLTNSATMLGLNLNNNLGTYYTETSSRGSTGPTSYFGGLLSSAVSTVAGWVNDPVNVITGEFHIDTADLTLPGPMPLQIRRNYSSSALSDNEFGYGWKLTYFPYLVVGDVTGGSQLIYGAEMDGSVIAYRRDTTDTNLFIPKTEDNPSLKNLHNGGAGSTGNPLNNRLVKTVKDIDPALPGNETVYRLSGPNGQVRTFVVQSFQIGTVSRNRPYLRTWKDANGNTLTFQFETNPTDAEYGLLKRIGANNGNFIGFSYDPYGHIVEAFTGDGRRIKYSYDSQGDLRAVTLPDGAVHTYDYEQETTTAGGESVQTSKHLLVRETKPNGRILENVYHADGSRRVVTQKAVVDSSTPNPVVNATFTYANSQNNTSGDPNYKTWSGTTTVLDAYNRATVFTYTHGLTTNEDDPETPAEVREWYLPGDNSAGAYPRSLKKITDRRGVVTFFKYDTRGNLVEKSIGTDANPADLNGDGVASAGEKAVTSWTYVPIAPLDRVETQTDPSSVVTKWFYEDGDYPYLATRIEKWAQGQLVSKTVRTFYEKLGTPSAYGLLQVERVAADSGDEAQVTWEHDNRGFPTKKTSLTGTTDPAVVVDLVHNLRGELIDEKDTLNRRWKYTCDAMGRRTWAERRDGGNNLVSWDYTYFNLNGEVEWTDGPRYNPEDYTWARYDGNGRRTEEIRWRSQANGAGTGVEAPAGDDLTSTTFFRHDKFNNLLEIRSPRRHSVWMEYDGIGRMTGRRFFEGYASSYAQAGSKASESFTYEPGGQVWTHTGVLGGTTTLLYNARGQMRKRTNADNSVEEWRYYNDGRVFKEILRNGSYWETTYDDVNRVVTRRLKNSGGTVLKTQVKAYDRRGNCTSETADGFTFTKTYDDLNRLKSATGPAATATSAQQVTTCSYPDGAGREERTTNGLNETTITLRDALGRVESVETRDAGQNAVRKTSYAYSADHSKVTTTEGTGAGAIVTQMWTDTFGKTVLKKKADGTAEYSFYDNGGLLVDHFDRALRETFYARNWRGDVTQEVRPGGVVINYVPDAAGNILQRNMPGGPSEQAQFDNVGRIQWSKLVHGGTTRLVNYAYHPTGHQWAGLLNTTTDARGIVTTYGYDAVLRIETQTSAGPDPEDALSHTLGYNERDQLTSFSETGLNGATQVTRTINGYGAISTETVSVGGVAQSTLTQYFDAAGRRWKLTGAGADRTFAHRADGLMLNTVVGGNTYAATYGDNGLLATRTNPFRSVNVQTRDSLGRITDLRTTVGGVLTLQEVVPSWNNLDKVDGVYSGRVGSGAWTEYRDYQYDLSGRLIYEDFEPFPGSGEDALYTAFDGALTWPGPTGGIGVRTVTQRDSDTVVLHQAPTVASYARVTNENVGGSQPRNVSLSGNAFGAGTVKLTLDGRDQSPVTFPGFNDSQGNWSATALLAPGYHYLTATATHPSGWVAAPANSFFQVLPRAETVTNGYDDMGNVATRTWSLGKAQTLTWDVRGRLVKVVQTGVNPFTWTALYDGLDRRVATSYTPNGGATVTTNSIFDPQVEFLELGLAINGSWNWKVYGPDLSERYGGLQGLGGLEGVVGSDSVTRGIINDWCGNTAGYVAAPGASLTWNSAQFLAWGPTPGWNTQPVNGTKPLHQLLGYHGLTLDPPGYYQQGLRPYDATVGRWLSPDPFGHAGSLSLYDYCDNDPLNVFDTDGRFGKYVSPGGLVSQGLTSLSNNFDRLGDYGVNSNNTALAMFGGGMSSLTGSLATMSSPQAIAENTVGNYQANLTMFEGSHYGAINATFNPAYQAMVGFTEAGTGTGLSAHNLGQTLSGLDRTGSFIQGVNGTAGTISVGLSGAALTRLATNGLTVGPKIGPMVEPPPLPTVEPPPLPTTGLPQYYIENGVRRSVASQQAGVTQIPATIYSEGQAPVTTTLRLDQLHSPKPEIPLDSRLLNIQPPIHTPIQVQPLGLPGQMPTVPVNQVKLIPPGGG